MTDLVRRLRNLDSDQFDSYVIEITEDAACRIEALERTLSEYKAARYAYASEFPPDANGEPNVGSIHENIRKLKRENTELQTMLKTSMEQHEIVGKLHQDALRENAEMEQRLKNMRGLLTKREAEHIEQVNYWMGKHKAFEAALKPGGEIVQLGSEWTSCVKLPITVHVRNQREGEKHISTREGITPVEPDDLIMRGVAGEEYPIGRELFQRTYRIGAAPPAQTPPPRLTDEQLSDMTSAREVQAAVRRQFGVNDE